MRSTDVYTAAPCSRVFPFLVLFLPIFISVVLPTGCQKSPPHQVPEPDPSSIPVPPVDFDALYIVSSGNHAISIVNSRLDETISVIGLENMANPSDLDLSPDGRRIVALATGLGPEHSLKGRKREKGATLIPSGTGTGSALILLDAETGRTLAARRLPDLRRNVQFHPAGDEIWVPQASDSGDVLVLDAHTLKSWLRIRIGALPGDLVFSFDGREAYVAVPDSNHVAVLDCARKRKIDAIPVGRGPGALWMVSNEMLLVANELDGSLWAVNPRSREIEVIYQLGFVPGSVLFGPDENIWISDTARDRVYVYRKRADVRIAEIDAGPGPLGMAAGLDGRTLYVADAASGTVAAIDIRKRVLRQLIMVGVAPHALFARRGSPVSEHAPGTSPGLEPGAPTGAPSGVQSDSTGRFLDAW